MRLSDDPSSMVESPSCLADVMAEHVDRDGAYPHSTLYRSLGSKRFFFATVEPFHGQQRAVAACPHHLHSRLRGPDGDLGQARCESTCDCYTSVRRGGISLGGGTQNE